jgi:hypothetical protein
LLDAQITLLDKQLRSIHAARPAGGAAPLLDDATPDLESWLQTLELMKMYDRWFSKEELQQLPFAVRMRWRLSGQGWLQRPTLLEQHMPDGRAGDGSGDALDGAPGAGYGGQAGVSDPPERDAQR